MENSFTLAPHYNSKLIIGYKGMKIIEYSSFGWQEKPQISIPFINIRWMSPHTTLNANDSTIEFKIIYIEECRTREELTLKFSNTESNENVQRAFNLVKLGYETSLKNIDSILGIY